MQKSTDEAYNRFLEQGRIAPLTMLGFFPALLLGDALLVVDRVTRFHGAVGIVFTIVGIMCVGFISLYGCIGLALGQSSTIPVLRGSMPWRDTAMITAAAYLLNTLFYILAHRGLTPTSDIDWTAVGIATLIGICFFGPVSEELALQGFVQTRLNRIGIVPAALLTTTLFVCMHLTAITRLPQLEDIAHIVGAHFPVLLTYAIVRQLTGSLLAVILLHAIDNATVELFLAR